MVFLVVIQWFFAVSMILVGFSGFVNTTDTMPEEPAIMSALIGVALLPVFNRFITDHKRRAVKYSAILVLVIMAAIMTPPPPDQNSAVAAAPEATSSPFSAPVSSANLPPTKATGTPAAKASVTKPVKASTTPKPLSKPPKPTPTATKAPSVEQQINAIYAQAEAAEMGPDREAFYLKATKVEPSEAFHYYMAAENANVNNRPRDAIRYLSQGLEIAGAHPKQNARHFARLYGQRAVSYKEILDCKSYERDMRLSCKYDSDSPDCPGDDRFAECPAYVVAVKEELARKGLPLP